MLPEANKPPSNFEQILPLSNSFSLIDLVQGEVNKEVKR